MKLLQALVAIHILQMHQCGSRNNDLKKIVTRHTPELNEVKIQSYKA